MIAHTHSDSDIGRTIKAILEAGLGFDHVIVWLGLAADELEAAEEMILAKWQGDPAALGHFMSNLAVAGFLRATDGQP